MVVYKGNSISIAIARLLVKIRFISLVNLIMDREVVKELIQQDCNPDKISSDLDLILHNISYREQLLSNYQQLSEKMGKAGASENAARVILKELNFS